MLKLKSHSEKETASIASEFTMSLKGGEVIGLSGELGAGKTFFVKAVSEALGVTDIVTSPSFSLRQEYITEHPTIKRLIHIDLYRLDNVSDREDFLEDIQSSDSVTFIEWPERLIKKDLITHQVDISLIAETDRTLTIRQ